MTPPTLVPWAFVSFGLTATPIEGSPRGALSSDTCATAVPLRFDGGRLVDVGEDDAAEDRAVGVRVLRHEHDPDRGLAALRTTFRPIRHRRGYGRPVFRILGGPKCVPTRATYPSTRLIV